MAERGGQPGNTNAAKGRRWSNAIERALASFPEKPVSLTANRGIDDAAHEFVAKLMAEKDIGFFRELGDRLDGKPPQAIVGDDEHAALQILISRAGQ
jgi:hypothetical protein